MAIDRLIWKIVLDFFILAVLGFTLLAITNWVEPYHRGYFENDDTIRLPFKNQMAVPVALLAGVGVGLNVVTIVITEVIRDRRGKSGGKFLSGRQIPGWVWKSFATIGIFHFGASCQQLIADFTKIIVGRLRPSFYDVCQPIPLNSTLNKLGYIVKFTCSGTTDPFKLKDMRLSFPSAHASFSMYCAVFFIS